MHKGQTRWTRLTDELSQRQGIERARRRSGPDSGQAAQLPEPEPARRRATRRRRGR